MQTELKQAQAIEQLHSKLQALSSRDLQLWSIGLLVIVVLAAGIVALIVPNIVWSTPAFTVAGRFLPQLFFGFIALIILFNIYVLGQRRELNAARQELVSQLMLSERTENVSLVDPLTQVFNRRYLDHIIPKEITLANRHGGPLTFVLVDIQDFKSVNARFGHLTGDQALIEVARVLRRTVTASDSVLRYGGDEFLLVLPDQDEAQAADLVQRVNAELECSNGLPTRELKLTVNCGVAGYKPGDDVRDVLRAAEEHVAQGKCAGVPARASLGPQQPQALLVCADPAAIETLRFILQSNRADVQLCACATAARAQLSLRKLDAVIIDCDLPGGPELASEMRTLPGGKYIILITLGDAELGRQAGANFVLEKPLSTALTARSLRVAHALMAAERARYFRQPVEMVVSLAFEHGDVRACTATDLSDGGMAIRSEHPLTVGARARLHFTLPGAAKVVETDVEIAWTDRAGRAGLRFVHMPAKSSAELQEWLAQKRHEHAGKPLKAAAVA